MAWNTVKSEDGIPKIGVCVPHTGNVNMEWVMKSWGPLIFRKSSWCIVHPFLCRGPPIDIAREDVTAQALEWGADYVFYLDSDVLPELPEDINNVLYQLYKRNLPIVSGMYRTKKVGNPWAMWKFIDKDRGFQPVEEFTSELVEVDVVGLGCCLVKSEVFEKIERPWFRWDLKYAPSEDFYFCLKATAEAGYRTVVDTKIRCSHLATVKILPGVIPAYIPPQI